jgi:serine/threonine protein kinase
MNTIPQQIGNYQLTSKIGQGATSEVWLARHLHLEQRQVAIKVLMSYDRDTVLRFRREANLASQLHHPNIVQVFDHGKYQTRNPPGQFYCTVLQYVDGGSLQTLLEKVGRLALSDAIDIVRQIAVALDYAHSLNIIHRDVKPDNVLVDGNTGHVLLTDFGIARDMNDNLTVEHVIMGTRGYWSPEHTRSATEVTALSDIYSLGIVLYVMLSGELPWDGEPRSAQHNAEPPPPLKQHGVTSVPAEVDRVLQTLLALDPHNRYPSAQAAIDELDRIVKRHYASTYVSPDVPASHRPIAPDPAPDDDIAPDAVETALGPRLTRAPMVEAHERADDLRQQRTLSALLDTWADQSPLRRPLLGRLARVHRISSRNVYAYRLRVLYEQRGQPALTEQPDYKQHVAPLEPELTRWQVSLSPVQSFEADSGGRVVLPGSTRVVKCAECEGVGKHVCPRCKGQQRIYETRKVPPPAEPPPAPTMPDQQPDPTMPPTQQAASTRARERVEQVLVPCPECEGSGGLTCEHCDGVGRMQQQRAFSWQRTPYTIEARDDLPGVDDKWLRRTCTWHDIYTERLSSNGHTNANPFRAEWEQIPQVQTMLKQARSALDDNARIVLSELTISFLPVSDVVFDLGNLRDEHDEARIYRLSIYGFENAIPPDWRFLNWERVNFIFGSLFLFVIVLILGFFAFTA